MNRERLDAKLFTVQRLTNEIISGINPEDFRGEAVNWGDLRAIEARFVITTSGDYFEVVVSEASPGAGGLACYIQRELESRHWDVYVVTEW